MRLLSGFCFQSCILERQRRHSVHMPCGLWRCTWLELQNIVNTWIQWQFIGSTGMSWLPGSQRASLLHATETADTQGKLDGTSCGCKAARPDLQSCSGVGKDSPGRMDCSWLSCCRDLQPLSWLSHVDTDIWL